MVTHRSLCTLAITRIIVVFFTLVVLTYPHSLARAQKPNHLPPIPTFGTGGSSNKSSAGVVTDGFKAFDALKIAERIKLLLKGGPLRENQHLTSDVKLRVIAVGDASILFQYGLPDDALLQELCLQDSPAAPNSSKPAHYRSIVASAMRDPSSGDDSAASADKECVA